MTDPAGIEPVIDDHGRPEPPLSGDEAATLLGFLDHQRATFAWKTRGLSDEQLRVTVAASSMSLGGMIKHLAYVEDNWFATVLGDTAEPEPWASVDWHADRDWDWHSAASDTGEALLTLWRESIDRSRDVVSRLLTDGPAALTGMHSAWGGAGSVSMRWVLVHMVEEYARHNGHADLLREALDGETGE